MPKETTELTDREKQLIITNAYQKCYMATHGDEKPSWVDADFKHCKDLLKQFTPQEVAGAIQYMFNNEDDWWNESTGVFMSLTSTKLIQKALGMMKSGSQVASEVFRYLDAIYKEKFHIGMLISQDTAVKLGKAAKKYNMTTLEKMWRKYLEADPEPDMRSFLNEKVINSYARRAISETTVTDSMAFYHCENRLYVWNEGYPGCINTGHFALDKYKEEYRTTPCIYCNGRMMRKDVWRKHRETIDTPVVAENATTDDDDDLDDNFL